MLKAELPGIEREDIDIRVENNLLTIRGERKREQRPSRRTTTASSAPTAPSAGRSRCRRRSTPSKVSAEFKDGVLTVALPAREEAKPRQIQVKVN